MEALKALDEILCSYAYHSQVVNLGFGLGCRVRRTQESIQCIINISVGLNTNYILYHITKLTSIQSSCMYIQSSDISCWLFVSQAALRRLHSILGPSVFKTSDVEQLIRPRLIDSFNMCAKTKESFV